MMVGYKNPPREHQFGPNNPGNLDGRPKGSKNKPKPVTENQFVNKMLENANRVVKGKENGEEVSLPRIDVVIESLFQEAAKRNPAAQKAYVQLFQMAETFRAADKSSTLQTALEYIRSWEPELARRERYGIVLPDPVPHPEDILTNPETGEVRIHGPRTREEKEAHDRFYEEWDDVNGKLMELDDELEIADDPEERERIMAEIRPLRMKLNSLVEVYPLYSSQHRENRARKAR